MASIITLTMTEADYHMLYETFMLIAGSNKAQLRLGISIHRQFQKQQNERQLAQAQAADDNCDECGVPWEECRCFCMCCEGYKSRRHECSHSKR